MTQFFDNPITIIAAVLGFFFLVVAMFKDFGRRNGSQLHIPGTENPEDSEKEVRLSDPFDAGKAKAPDPVNPSQAKASAADGGHLKERSAFKQFAPDATTVTTVKIKDDSDYQWE